MARKVALVEEQSHKDEMRAALRGDFERLRARGRAGEVAHGPAHSRDAPSSEQRRKARARLRDRLFRRG